MRWLYLIVLILSALSISNSAYGLEPGFYSDFPGFKDAKARKLLANIPHPDLTINFRAMDEIRITRKSATQTIDERKQNYFSRDKIRQLIKAEQHKDFLIVWFEKTMMVTPQKDLQQMKPFLNQLGYGRVLVLGAHSMGVIVLEDREKTK
jgi:hypothetical protein